MKEPLKYFLERTTPLGALVRKHRRGKLEKKFQQWQAKGAIAPMPNFGKHQVVIEYIKKFSPAVFIETGTYRGKMVYAVMPYINQIYSIELDRIHYQMARRRFAGYQNIHIIQGQSDKILPKILEKIDKPCLFWLDAHWSGGSTAKAEIQSTLCKGCGLCTASCRSGAIHLKGFETEQIMSMITSCMFEEETIVMDNQEPLE